MPTKHALIVGINAYPVSPLAGCLNDVDSLAALLEAPPFRFDEITVLKDGQATSSKILEGMRRLMEDVQPGDSRVFAFAGHGTTMGEIDPAGRQGNFEFIIPWEFNARSCIALSTLYGLLASKTPVRSESGPPMPKASVTMILDCCHSGDPVRGGLIEAADGTFVEAARPRFVDPGLMVRAVSVRDVGFGFGPVNAFTACKQEETAKDLSPGTSDVPVARGAFSFVLHKVIAGNPSIAIAELDARVQAGVNALIGPNLQRFGPQTPQFFAVDPSVTLFTLQSNVGAAREVSKTFVGWQHDLLKTNGE